MKKTEEEQKKDEDFSIWDTYGPIRKFLAWLWYAGYFFMIGMSIGYIHIYASRLLSRMGYSPEETKMPMSILNLFFEVYKVFFGGTKKEGDKGKK